MVDQTQLKLSHNNKIEKVERMPKERIELVQILLMVIGPKMASQLHLLRASINSAKYSQLWVTILKIKMPLVNYRRSDPHKTIKLAVV